MNESDARERSLWNGVMDMSTQDDDDWATIRALLRAGCSMPERLQRKYDAHMRSVRENAFGEMKRRAERGEIPGAPSTKGEE